MRIKSRAFTLVEIVVVVAIIAILATVILVSYGNVVENSKKSKAKGEAQSFVAGAKMMKLDTGEYPGHMNNLCNVVYTSDGIGGLQEFGVDHYYVGLIKNDDPDSSKRYKNWNGPYMEQMGEGSPSNAFVTKDPWGNNYQFDPDYFCGGNLIDLDFHGATWEVGDLEEACQGVIPGGAVRAISSEHVSDTASLPGHYGGGNVAALICKP